jgi:hypothetical protein
MLRLLSESVLKDLLGRATRPEMTAEYLYSPARR